MSRGISTVVDVAFFLLLVSAAVLTTTALLATTDEGADPIAADRAAETVAATTTSVEYSLEPVAENDDTGTFDGAEFSDDAYVRVAHGPTASLLADAAVANVRFGDDRLTYAGADFEEAVASNAVSALEGANDDVHLVAVWRPHEGSTIEGRAVAGRQPPPDADVGAATVTVSSGMPAIPERELVDAYGDGGLDAASRRVAEAIVDGYLPPEESTLALERQGIERALVVYRYRRFAAILNADLDPDAETVSRSGADAGAANEELAAALATTIESDLADELESEIARIEADLPPDERDEAIGEAIADAVSTGEVTITVRTW